MTLTCKEEVFTWFQTLSGAKRIEMMCGLMSMCIPLEIRYFETVIQDLAKKDFNTFRDAEIKANSRQELEQLCKCDLFAEKCTPEYEENEMNGNGDGSASSGTNEPNQKALLKYPSRSKLIISLCLLQPTNHQCSSITYNSLRQQFQTENLIHQVYNVYIPKNYPLEGLFNEILLLLTMAVYHPAFSYEERDLLMKQKEDIEHFITTLNLQFRQSALQQSNATAIQPPPPTQVPTTVTPISLSVGQATNQPTYANPNALPLHQHNPTHTQHPQAASQVHSYHPYGGQHPQPNPTVKTNQQPHLVHLHQGGSFPIQFMQIANMPYTPPPTAQPATGQVANQTNMPNMSTLRLNSPPSISSTSPSPTISPSTSVKMAVPAQAPVPNPQQITIKLADGGMYTTAAGLPPNSQLTLIPPGTFVGDTTGASANNLPPPGIPFLNLPSTHPVIVDEVQQQKSTSSVSSNTSISSSAASCYNCGSVGHRGTECTSGGEDNR